MQTTSHALSPPSLEEISSVLSPCLQSNFEESSISVVQCPDLREAPFFLAGQGLSGNERIADVGGQPHIYPEPILTKKYSLVDVAKEMEMSASRGLLIGASGGPWFDLGINSELSPNLSWENGFENLKNLTHFAKLGSEEARGGPVFVGKCPTANCGLMANLFGSEGLPGEVIKITARGRTGTQRSLTELLRRGLAQAYGTDKQVSLGGVMLLKAGKAQMHVMPGFLKRPFKDFKDLNDWLTYFDMDAPLVCLSVLHSTDTEKLGLRMEHTHCFAVADVADTGEGRGGHYHGDLDDHEVEYEAYFNTAKMLYRVDEPVHKLEKDLHDD